MEPFAPGLRLQSYGTMMAAANVFPRFHAFSPIIGKKRGFVGKSICRRHAPCAVRAMRVGDDWEKEGERNLIIALSFIIMCVRVGRLRGLFPPFRTIPYYSASHKGFWPWHNQGQS